jgi:hypothetical protein
LELRLAYGMVPTSEAKGGVFLRFFTDLTPRLFEGMGQAKKPEWQIENNQAF